MTTRFDDSAKKHQVYLDLLDKKEENLVGNF